MTIDPCRRAAPGHVTEPVTRTRGWCPGILDPMETGDGWLLRVRLPGGQVTQGLLARAAEIGRELGSGLFDVTSRANLQIRGVPFERLGLAIARARDGGLTGGPGLTAAKDALRSVVASPLAGHDPAAVRGADHLVHLLVERLIDRVDGAVPPKFGIVIDDGGCWPLDHLDADIGLVARSDGSWSVRLRGVSRPIGRTLRPLETVEAATQLCVEQGRMDQVVANVDRDELLRRLDVQPGSDRRGASAARSRRGRILGVVPHREPDLANVVVAPFLGRVDAAALESIAALAVEHAAALRLTPDRSLAFCGVARSAVGSLRSALRDLGLVVDRRDARASISACVGSAGCSWASADARAAAEQLAAAHRAVGAGRDLPRVHLSACAKACGAPRGVRHLVADHTGTFR